MAINDTGADTGLHGVYTFLPQDRVIFGAGSLAELAGAARRLDGHRVLVVTGQTLAMRTPVVDEVVRALGGLHAGTAPTIGEHAPRSGVDAAVVEARWLEADLLVSVGGGSPIDAAKAVALALEDERGRIIPHIAIPTTLSAAEFSHLAGVTDEDGDRRMKAGFADPRVTPRAVVLDAQLTLHTPPTLWLSSGIRALDHAVETLYAPGPSGGVGTHPINDVLALEAIRLLFLHLPRSQEQPDDLATRTQLQLAAWMSFFGEVNTPMGLSHNLGRAMGATYHVPHGITSCLTLPHVMRFKAWERAAAAALAPIARVLGLPTPPTAAASADVASADAADAVRALAAADAVANLIARLGLPHHLTEVGIDEDQIPAMAARVAGDPTRQAQVEDLLRSML